MEQHLSSLQDVVRLTIRQELTWSEQRFKRITMSQDADHNPAELYGADGKIYYRKAGGAGVEIGAGGVDGLWEISGVTKIAAIVNRPVIHEYVWLKDGGSTGNTDLTWWVEFGGGGGGHPDEQPEV